jgi:hypothetical protein
LGKDREVGFLIGAYGKEIAVLGSSASVLDQIGPNFRARLEWPPGLARRGRPLVLFDVERGRALVEVTSHPTRPSMHAGVSSEVAAHRVVSLAELEGDRVGLLAMGGLAAEAAGLATLDEATGTFGPFTRLARWSEAVSASDPRCQGKRRGEARALVAFEGPTWFRWDLRSMPSTRLSGRAMVLVRWSEDRVCIDAIDAELADVARVSDKTYLVAQFGSPSSEAALLTDAIAQPLVCRIAKPQAPALKVP